MVGQSLDKPEARTEDEVSLWNPLPREYTQEEERVLTAKAIMMALEASFSNHIYEFQGELYLQLEGATIGVRLTGEVARLVMDSWAQEIRSSLKRSKLELYLLSKYVDDVSIVSDIIPKGYR